MTSTTTPRINVLSVHKDTMKTIKIQPGASLNSPQEEQPGFPESLYETLPKILRYPCLEVLRERTEKEVFLVGALGVLSGCLPNVKGFYDQKFYSPHLYVYILAPYGSGKGALTFARELGQQIHQKRRELSAEKERQYEHEKKRYDEGLEDEEPVRPGNLMLFLPANNSKTGLNQLLQDNEKGILFETEGDTLADALDQKHGNFADLLNKSFHHEPISYYRRTEREYSDIPEPRLSVVLSSTFDQYRKLIPTIQNGLFSRFLHYTLTPNRQFRNVFDRSKRRYPEYFREMGEKVYKIYDKLEGAIAGVEFQLNSSHETRFLAIFETWKEDLADKEDLDGTINRLGLIAFRIAMIFSVLRAFEVEEYPPEKIVCSDEDFDNAILIVEALKAHAVKVYSRLPRPATTTDEEKETEEQLNAKARIISTARQFQAEGMSYRQIALNLLGDEKKASTVHGWLNGKKE